MKEKNLLYEWNKIGNNSPVTGIEINDETLRDGIQASGIRQPTLEDKFKIVESIADLAIDTVCIGFPAVSTSMMRDVEEIIRYILANKFSLNIACAARTMIKDIQPIVELSQKYGIPIDANIFVGSSPVRQFVEGWDIDYILNLIEDSIGFARKNNVPVCFITEDTTRSKPDALKTLYLKAVACGAYRICLCDTVGYALPSGAAHLVESIKSTIEETGQKVMMDWHSHNDRGLALENALAALKAGVNRIHATGLGIGERSGNTSMEQLLVNLKLAGLRDTNLIKLKKYCVRVSEALGYEIPINFPIVGNNAFATASGIHAAAIIKAQQKGHDWLADRVYSSVPAQELGFEQKIEIGSISGKDYLYSLLTKNNITDNNFTGEIFKPVEKSNKLLPEYV